MEQPLVIDALAKQALSPLRSFLDDPLVQEIMINGPGQRVFVERRGDRVVKVDVTLTESQIAAMVTLASSASRKEVDLHAEATGEGGKKHAIVSASLPDLRIEAQLAPVAIRGPYVTIRRRMNSVLPLEKYVEQGAITPAVADFLTNEVRTAQNMLVVGGTSTGKTTFLNALIQKIPLDARLFVVETVEELIIEHENVVRLEADEEQGYSMLRLVRSGLRSRPDRFLLGEIRGPEAFPFMEAAMSGHDGLMGSLHANSGAEGLDRFEGLVQEARPAMALSEIRRRIAQTFSTVVHMERTTDESGRVVRRLGEVIRIHGIEDNTGSYKLEKLF